MPTPFEKQFHGLIDLADTASMRRSTPKLDSLHRSMLPRTEPQRISAGQDARLFIFERMERS
jgi:hypothetical protein